MKVFAFILMVAMTVAIGTGFTGCSTTQTGGGNDVTKQVEYACAASATALKGLTIANGLGKLSSSQQEQIVAAAEMITPICTAPNTPTLTQLEMTAFMAAVGRLQLAQKSLSP